MHANVGGAHADVCFYGNWGTSQEHYPPPFETGFPLVHFTGWLPSPKIPSGSTSLVL